MKVIAYVNPETGVTAIVRPAASNRLDTESEEQFLARVISRAVPGGVAYEIIDDDPILHGDRTFRNALKCDGGKLSHDMEACRSIHMDRIRKARDAELAKLDVATIQAVGKGDDATRDAVEAEKQKLRDLPATFDLSAARSTEELKALWPNELAKA